MRFTCDKALLYDAVMNVSKAVNAKSTLPVLEGILLKLEHGSLTLVGFDLEFGIRTSLAVRDDEAGEIVLSARLFGDILKRLPAGDVLVECDGRLSTRIEGGSVEYIIMAMSAEDYPQTPEIHADNRISLPQATLKSMIGQTLFAVAVTEQKPVHTGSLFSIKESTLNLVSVDGYRLAVRTERIDGAEDMHFVVPAKTLSEVARLLSDEDDKQVYLDLTRKHILFDTGEYMLISRLLEGDFLDYASSIPKGSETEVLISTRELIDSLERVSLLITEKQRSPVRCVFENGEVRLSCATAVGTVKDVFRAEMTGPSVEIGFNNRYLLDALRASESDEVRLQMAGALSPMKLLPVKGESFLFLVLPVRLKVERT